MSDIDKVLELAKMGFRLHPLHSRNKVPILGRWQDRASTVESTIKMWSAQHKDCNWGIATGKESGIVVVDIDPTHDGNISWRNLVSQFGDVHTVSVKTGSGGTHYYFKYPAGEEIGNSSGQIGKGIDVRGNDGQVVAPFSIHPNGNIYQWINSPEDVSLADLPTWILDKIKSATVQDYSSVGNVVEKGNRNNSMYHAALALARQGSPMEFALTAIHQWMSEQGHDDIPEDEVLATVDSAYKSAKKKIIDINDRSDTLNAEILIDTYGEDLIYVSGMGWFYWNGKVWEPDEENAKITQLFISCMKTIREDTAQKMAAASSKGEIKDLSMIMQWTVKSLSIGSINAAIDLASTFNKVRKTTADIDPINSLWLLNCNNGTVNLKTGELQKHNKKDMITKMVPIDYNKDAKCEFWKNTFDLVFDENADLITFMQKALGYSITGSVDERCFFICWGESGANGKSTILETVQDMLGVGYAQMSDMVVITSSTTDNRVSSSLAKLQGARFVSMNEAEENQKLSEALVKQLTGGDTVQACFKYKNPFEYKPIFKLWIRTNEKPIIRSQNNSIWDRIKLIPFEKPIPKEKRLPRSEVDAKLLEEREGILTWLVDGAMQWIKDGSLNDPNQVSAAVQGYRTDSDIVRLFIEECGEEQRSSKVKSAEAYQAFVGWSRDAGERYVMTRTKFVQRCSSILGTSTTRSGGSTYIVGMKLNSQASMYVN